MPVFFPNVLQIFELQISDCTRKSIYVQSFRRLAKENHAWFYQKHLGRYDSIVLSNDNFLEQELENFNRYEVGNEEPLGSDNNGEEEE